MAEGWTREETRRRHRWCECKGYGSGGIPVCTKKAAFLSPVHGEQRCQRSLKRHGYPPTSKEHVLSIGYEHGGCVSWCPACAENTERGLNTDGTRKETTACPPAP